VPSDEVLEAQGAVIGEIEFVILDVFDPENPKENNWLFRTANTLHIDTRQRVIRHVLLFREGDPYRARDLQESERLLRSMGYLYDARILPVAYEDGRVRVRVITRDVWTLQVGVSFGRSGGANAYRFGVSDTNFLGFGKRITLQRSKDVDRTSDLYSYGDPNLVGTRWRLLAAYQDNSDGFQRQLVVERPFYSLETHWSTGANLLNYDRVDSLYKLGEIAAQFRQEQQFYEGSAGFSRGVVHGASQRFSGGLTYNRNRFGAAPDEPPSPEQPADRTLVYPWFGYEYIADDYARLRNLDQIERTEDLHFGLQASARLGWCSELFGADRNQAVLASFAQIGLVLGRGRWFITEGHAGGRFGRDGSENVLVGGSARYDMRVFGRHGFHVAAGVDFAHNLDGENQLLLGGDNGLRGYPLRYQDGDRRYLITVEQRFYTPWQILRLVNLGAAVFADAGAAWFAGTHDDPTQLGLLRDVGFGLRVASARSSRGSMIHVDLAFPLDGGDTIERVQLLVNARDSF